MKRVSGVPLGNHTINECFKSQGMVGLVAKSFTRHLEDNKMQPSLSYCKGADEG